MSGSNHPSSLSKEDLKALNAYRSVRGNKGYSPGFYRYGQSPEKFGKLLSEQREVLKNRDGTSSSNLHPFKKPSPEEANWYLWNGEKSWHIGNLSLEEQTNYPERGIYNSTGLIEAIETGMSGDLKLC